jgi:tetratricopeptide (TPR) repeat protein
MLETIVRNKIKIGRNDPCFCGSNKKYKKCCIDKEQIISKTTQESTHSYLETQRENRFAKLKKISDLNNIPIKDLDIFFMDKEPYEIDIEYDQTVASIFPRDIAEDLLSRAEGMYPGEEKTILIKKAIQIYPHLPDAFVILAIEVAQTKEEALEYYKKAVMAGEIDLGQEFFEKNKGHFWKMRETRPYLLAKVFLAEHLWELGLEDESITHYNDYLLLNTDDNLKVRNVLTAKLLIRNNFEAVVAIQEKYKEESSASYCYNRALLLFKKLGIDSEEAFAQLRKAISLNKFVSKCFLGEIKIPNLIPSSAKPKSREEAIIYTYDTKRAWDETPGAITWLLRQIK